MMLLLFNIVINFLKSKVMHELLLSVLFTDDIDLASERVPKLQEVFDKWKEFLEDPELVSQRLSTCFYYSVTL